MPYQFRGRLCSCVFVKLMVNVECGSVQTRFFSDFIAGLVLPRQYASEVSKVRACVGMGGKGVSRICLLWVVMQYGIVAGTIIGGWLVQYMAT